MSLRDVVAEQVAELIRESGITGSPDLIAARVREIVAAQRTGDPYTVRAAAMNVAVAAAAYAVQIDMTTQGRGW